MAVKNKINKMTFKCNTESVIVTVVPEFNKTESNSNTFIWLYHIKIDNRSDSVIQIIGRFWQIFHASGLMEEVEGENIVGKQPVLHPGEQFEYTSQVRLFACSGMMRGHYVSKDLTLGDTLLIEVPAFSLDSENIKDISLN